MFKLTHVASLALGLALLGGLSTAASAHSMTPASQIQSVKLQNLQVENGSEHLQQNRVAEGGADHTSSARLTSQLVAENRAEFGSQYQRY